MFDRVIRRMRELVHRNRYVMTVHGQEEMEADHLTALDVESCFATGHVTHRQKDAATGEWKYVIVGEDLSGRPATVVAKVGATGKLVIITVYLL